MESDPPTEDDYSLMILKNRLAKGEITSVEFDILKKKLTEDNTITKLKDEIKNVNEKMEKMSKEQGSTQAITNKIRQYKSVGTTATLSIVLGLVGIWGIGHLYIGEKRKGIAFLITGLFLVIWIILLVTGATYWTNGNIENYEQFSFISAVGFVIGIPYLILYVVQIITAIRSCQKHNRYLDQIGGYTRNDFL